MDEVVITVLVEDGAPLRGLRGEHGLCLLIEADGVRVLFDTGQTGLALDNARALGTPLRGVSDVVLSHGHYDHTGGLGPLLAALGPLTVHGHPDTFAPRFEDEDGKRSAIGSPLDAAAVRAAGARLEFHARPRRLPWGWWLTGVIPRRDPEDQRLVGSRAAADGRAVPDALEDDLALAIPTGSGLIVVMGCAHAGLFNTIEACRAVAGDRRVRAVIGGLHLRWDTDQAIDRAVERLAGLGAEVVAPCHCTGFRAQVALLRALPTQTRCLGTGFKLSWSRS